MKSITKVILSSMVIAGMLFLYAMDEVLYAKVVLIAVIPGAWIVKNIILSLYAAEIRLTRRIIQKQLKNFEPKPLKPLKQHLPKTAAQ